MLEPARSTHATFEGTYAHVRDAINVPKPVQQPRVPIMVGGNGPNVTWRLAARFADELNLDGMEPGELDEALPVIRSRCEEIGRDPATLPVSVHIGPEQLAAAGNARVDQLVAYREAGIRRVQTLLLESVTSDDALASFAADARASGAELA